MARTGLRMKSEEKPMGWPYQSTRRISTRAPSFRDCTPMTATVSPAVEILVDAALVAAGAARLCAAQFVEPVAERDVA